jgi:hypothetical protein
MAWLGLDLCPERKVEDLIRGVPGDADAGLTANWFLQPDAFPANAVASKLDGDARERLMLQKLDTEKIEKTLDYTFKEKTFLIQGPIL